MQIGRPFVGPAGWSSSPCSVLGAAVVLAARIFIVDQDQQVDELVEVDLAARKRDRDDQRQRRPRGRIRPLVDVPLGFIEAARDPRPRARPIVAGERIHRLFARLGEQGPCPQQCYSGHPFFSLGPLDEARFEHPIHTSSFVNSCKAGPVITRTRDDRLGDSTIHRDLRRIKGQDGEDGGARR